ncbi:zinc finger protein 345-like [Ixodes scapularis]|uniref:zinc finger protein 345-like n=1 Tax=Ixodes scapularis TaxID=6945 RepID=UPI001C37F79F|nr:zinc finger protein 345-like [Ixodes scapularis]
MLQPSSLVRIDDCKTSGQQHSLNNESLQFRCKAPGDAPPKLVCQFCSYSTVYSTTMVRHVRTHTGERPYRCVSCKKGFTTQQQLEKHCSQPLKPCYKPFECNYCSERFPTDTMLTRHQRLHVFSTF